MSLRTTLLLLLGFVGCSSSSAEEGESKACDQYAPAQCPSWCMTTQGWPIANDCVDFRNSTELSCEQQGIVNGLISCAEREDDGAMFSLPSDTYRQLLEQRSGWRSCSGTWQNLPNCD
jgi:hypothetical protein